jgi:ABC-2 type transport system permease protein
VGLGLPAKRSGFGHWVESYVSLLRWEATSLRLVLVLLIIAQTLMGAGFVLGIGLLFEDIPLLAATYLSTGAMVVTLISVGLIVGPQLVAQQKTQQVYDFMWSLPVPRSAAAAAWVSINVVIAVPGMLVALLAATLRYGIDFDVTWAIVPAVGLTLVCGTMLGYALAHAIPKPEITQLISQLLIFVVVGFAPINYPPENLPGWLASAHEVLPFVHMARVVRDALVEGLVTSATRSYVVLAVWTLFAAVVSAFVLRGRR